MGFAELSITSNFTFLTGGSHPEEYAGRAALLGLIVAFRRSIYEAVPGEFGLV